MKSEVLKSEFYDKITFVPRLISQRIAAFQVQSNFIVDLIERGDKHVATVALAHMLQLRNELEGVVDPDTGRGVTGIRAPAQQKEARNLKADKGNHSALQYMTGQASGASAGKKRGSASNTTKGSSNKKRTASGSKAKSASGGTKKKGGAKKGGGTASTVSGQFPCPFCTVLCQQKDFKIRFDHSSADCPRIEEYGTFMTSIDDDGRDQKEGLA